MGSLHNVVIARREISVGDVTVSVRGVSFADLMTIVNTYGPQTAMVWGRIQAGQSLNSTDVKSVIGQIAGEFPSMVAAVLALATDSYDEEGVKIAAQLPMAKQVEMVEAIFELTFTSEGEIKKLIGSLTRVATTTSGALTEISLASLTGAGGSAAA